jgi:hypothetical protein
MYKQTLIKSIEPVKRTTITRMNRGKKWKYGYNKEHDLIVLSHNGTIGEMINIQKTSGLSRNILKNYKG